MDGRYKEKTFLLYVFYVHFPKEFQSGSPFGVRESMVLVLLACASSEQRRLALGAKRERGMEASPPWSFLCTVATTSPNAPLSHCSPSFPKAPTGTEKRGAHYQRVPLPQKLLRGEMSLGPGTPRMESFAFPTVLLCR